jgi:hypothetical protein
MSCFLQYSRDYFCDLKNDIIFTEVENVILFNRPDLVVKTLKFLSRNP